MEEDRTREYKAWQGMKCRCLNQKNKNYNDYGGRGIGVCNEWQNSYDQFVADMGRKPTPKHSLERRDNSGNYEPSNCRWATVKEQANNRRSNKIIEFEGRTMNMKQWAEEVGLPYGTLKCRLGSGWTVQRALTTPQRRI